MFQARKGLNMFAEMAISRFQVHLRTSCAIAMFKADALENATSFGDRLFFASAVKPQA
jgi:hypothetical protein